ncbi:cytoplasmic protein [Microbacterium sp.]|uniref:cytoplasmic protein n=1 Tax=Microbacterium sp. TaxID=51671 RepID=UPI002E339A6D|nr:cytoplasmic protein [Microbacterium sp.]HEX5728197.1 cytoplasmic protein [Microbacterium sp.]
MVEEDPVTTNPAHYRTMFENEFVRVLEYIDDPGDTTTPHVHPNSVMVTLTDFQRRLRTGAGERDVDIAAHQAMWVPAQRHAGENIGRTATHTIFVELKGDAAGVADGRDLGPST